MSGNTELAYLIARSGMIWLHRIWLQLFVACADSVTYLQAALLLLLLAGSPQQTHQARRYPAAGIRESGGRNPAAGIRRPVSGGRNPGIRRPESGNPVPESGGRNPAAGIRESGAGIRRPESGGRNPGIRRRNPAAGIRESGAGSRVDRAAKCLADLGGWEIRTCLATPWWDVPVCVGLLKC